MPKFRKYSIIRNINSRLLYRVTYIHTKPDWSLDHYDVIEVEWYASIAAFSKVSLETIPIYSINEKHYELVL